jgi:hypothetical protein
MLLIPHLRDPPSISMQAVKIALEVKKRLVDNNKLDITQEELELELFASLKMWGFGDDNVERFRMTMRFQQERRPLIVLIIGSACTGKSSLAQALASRLNLPNVLQTDMLGSLLPAPTAQRVASSGTLSWLANFPKDRGVDDVPVDTSPSNASAHGTDTAGVISQFVEECKVMWRALQGDLHKCVLDGKSIIIEGLYLDPGILLGEFEGRIVGTGSHSLPSLASGDDVSPQQCKLPRVRSCNGDDNAQNAIIQNLSTLEVRDRKTSSDPGDAAAWSEEEVGHPARPVIVPLILRMDEDDYPIVAEEWLRTRLSPESDGLARQKLLSRLIAVQQYLAGYEAADMHVLHTGILDFQKTLDAMHDICLFGMELALQAPPCEVGAGCRAPKQCQP